MKLRTLICLAIIVLVNISATEKMTPVFDTPYDNQEGYIQYWKGTLDEYYQFFGIPEEVILAKMWMETNGGTRGAGIRGAIFGIKGEGIKGHDAKEKHFASGGAVEYQYYSERWEAISHFCRLLNKPMYRERFEAWHNIYPDMPEWYSWLLALQVHPDKEKSKWAYASCGVQDGSTTKGYKTRRAHADKCIRWVLEEYYPFVKKFDPVEIEQELLQSTPEIEVHLDTTIIQLPLNECA